MRKLILLVLLSVALPAFGQNEAVTINTKTKKVVNPRVNFGTGNTLDATGATLIGFATGAGNVSNSGTPLLDQVAVWTDATHIKGVTTIKGGTTGQVLTKSSNTDYAYVWSDPAGGVTSFNTRTGAVTSQSGDYTTAIVADSSDKRYVTDAQLVVIGNTSGTNSGDIALSGENYISLSGQALTANAVNLSGTNATGTLAAGRFPALTGEVTTSAGSLATTITRSTTFAWTGSHSFTRSTSTISPVVGLILGHNASSGTPGANFGTSIIFRAEDSTTDDQSLGLIQATWVNPTHGTATSRFTIGGLLNAGSAAAGIMSLYGTGGVDFAISGATNDPGAGYLNVATGYKVAGTEFPIASNGIPVRTAANTWTPLTIGDGLNLTGTTLAANTPTPTPTATPTSTPTPTPTATPTATAVTLTIDGVAQQIDVDRTWSENHSVTFVVDGGGIVLGTGTKNPIKVKYGGTLFAWTMMCKPSGSVTADVLRAADGAGLPVTSIVGGGGTKPSITTGVENSSTSFTAWTSTAITDKDNMAIDLTSVTTATYMELTLYFK